MSSKRRRRWMHGVCPVRRWTWSGSLVKEMYRKARDLVEDQRRWPYGSMEDRHLHNFALLVSGVYHRIWIFFASPSCTCWNTSLCQTLYLTISCNRTPCFDGKYYISFCQFVAPKSVFQLSSTINKRRASSCFMAIIAQFCMTTNLYMHS
jgi:hypothetical protein